MQVDDARDTEFNTMQLNEESKIAQGAGRHNNSNM